MHHFAFAKSQIYRRVACVLMAGGVAACQPGQSQAIRPDVLPQDERIQVYLNQNPAVDYTEPYRQQTRLGDDLEQVIVDAIQQAQSTIDVAVQELRLPRIATALAERQKAGVRVRVILENTYARPFSQYSPADVEQLPPRERDRYNEFRQLVDHDNDQQLTAAEISQGDALVILDEAGVKRIDDREDGSAGSNLMHHKILIVDGRTLIVTSANWTTSDVHGDFKSPSSRGNANNLLKIQSPELAALFTQEFDVMWGDGPGGQRNSRFGVKKPVRAAQTVMVGTTAVTVQFSPTPRSRPWPESTNGLIGKVLLQAKRSVNLALFVFSDQQLVNQLESVHRTGVEVRALIEPSFAYRPYSEALDMLGIELADNCTYEAGNRPWQPAIATVGVPRLPPGDLLHHKFGVIDGQTVVTGSHNFSDAANNGNDETLLVIQNPTVAAHYQREYERLETDAVLGIPPAIQKKADAQRQQCQPNKSNTRTEVQPTPVPMVTPTPRLSPSSSPSPQQRINLNTATQAELETLPGVGPKLAQRIITARQQNRFTSMADLDRVPGVGPQLLKRLDKQVSW